MSKYLPKELINDILLENVKESINSKCVNQVNHTQ